MAKDKIELGDQVKDQISGFAGVCVAITTWLNGCVRITVQPDSLTKEGAPKANETFDEQQILVVKKKKVAVNIPAVAPGGPRPAPTRSADPGRR